MNVSKLAKETRPVYQAVIAITPNVLVHVLVALSVLMDVLDVPILFAIQF